MWERLSREFFLGLTSRLIVGKVSRFRQQVKCPYCFGLLFLRHAMAPEQNARLQMTCVCDHLYIMIVPLGVARHEFYTLLQFTQTFSCRRLKHSHAVYTPLCSLCAREPRYSNLLVTCHKSSCFEANAAKSSDMDVMCGDFLLLHLH